MPVRNNGDGLCLRYFEMVLAHNRGAKKKKGSASQPHVRND